MIEELGAIAADARVRRTGERRERLPRPETIRWVAGGRRTRRTRTGDGRRVGTADRNLGDGTAPEGSQSHNRRANARRDPDAAPEDRSKHNHGPPGKQRRGARQGSGGAARRTIATVAPGRRGRNHAPDGASCRRTSRRGFRRSEDRPTVRAAQGGAEAASGRGSTRRRGRESTRSGGAGPESGPERDPGTSRSRR